MYGAGYYKAGYYKASYWGAGRTITDTPQFVTSTLTLDNPVDYQMGGDLPIKQESKLLKDLDRLPENLRRIFDE